MRYTGIDREITLFRFAYPSERELVPRGVMRELARRLELTIDAARRHER